MNNVSEKNKRLVLDAKTLLLEFLAAVTHGQDAAALFAEDGALELPFLHSVGIPWRHRGRQAIRELQDGLAGLYLDLAFKPEDTHVLIDTPEQVFAEYVAHMTAKATGRTLHHLFAARLVAENGLIKLVRESLNVVAAAQALLPGGVKDLPDPEKEIFSVPPDYRSLGRREFSSSIVNHQAYRGSTAMGDNVQIVLNAFETLFNKRDYAAAERFWSPNYIQHSAHIPPGREGLFALIKGAPEALRYENGLTVANGDYVLLHGRFSGLGRPANWIVVDIVRLENGQLAEHWDVIEDEATKEASLSGLPMFGDKFPG